MDDCIFCAIVAGRIPGQFVLREDDVVAFRDVDPRAPSHVLVIPVAHRASLLELAGDPALAGRLLATAARVAVLEGLAGSGFRTVFNTGGDAGQSVAHVHAHVLGGRPMGWPPFPA